MLRANLESGMVSFRPYSFGQASDRPTPTEGVGQETPTLDEKSC